jgi:hypothetical protein
MEIEKEKLVEAFKNWLEDKNELPAYIQKIFKKEIKAKDKKYPNVLTKINYSEVEDLLDQKDIKATTSLEKILIGILWKQGDYRKISTFIQDLSDEVQIENKKSGFVFQQFAKHVKEANSQDQYEPIIDQHTLRAFLILKGVFKIEDSHNITTINKKLSTHFPKYISWFNEQLKKGHDPKVLDDYLFVLGKTLKK